MAKQKKEKWRYKHLSEDKFNEYLRLTKDQVIETLKTQCTFLDEKKLKKKKSSSLKTLAAEIKEYKQNYKKNDQIAEAKAEYDKLVAERDKEIYDEIEDRKALLGAMQDDIKGAEEHRDALLHILRLKN